jgi:enterochelin esterase-like enzyme
VPGLAWAMLSCSSPIDRELPLSFPVFLAAYHGAPDSASREEILSRFWTAVLQRGTPLVEPGDSSAVFLVRGSGDSAAVIGDMTRWKDPVPMSRLGGSDLFYTIMKFPYDARADYQIIVGAEDPMVDPANPRQVMGGYGMKSELAMPGFLRSEELDEQQGVPKGTLVTFTYRSPAPGSEHSIHVYLPAEYERAAARYPVAYFQDGGDYLSMAGARRILDNMIGGGSIRPIIAVFVVPPMLPRHNRLTEYAMNDAYVKFLVSRLVPHIDSTYRTLARARERVILGPSFAGLISLYAAFRHPDMFGNAASQSGYAGYGNDTLITLFRTEPARQIRLYLDVGTFETAVGPGSGGGQDFLAGNRRLRDVLEERGYSFIYREFHDGHSWGRWQNELPFILRNFFPWLR